MTISNVILSYRRNLYYVTCKPNKLWVGWWWYWWWWGGSNFIKLYFPDLNETDR